MADKKKNAPEMAEQEQPEVTEAEQAQPEQAAEQAQAEQAQPEEQTEPATEPKAKPQPKAEKAEKPDQKAVVFSSFKRVFAQAFASASLTAGNSTTAQFASSVLVSFLRLSRSSATKMSTVESNGRSK